MSKTKRKFLAVMAICGAGTLFQTGLVPSGCVQGLGQTALTTFDICSILNCTGGSFFNPCEPVPIFVDCPNLVANP